MIKLKREGVQLNLFDWKPKETPYVYDGLEDKDSSKWLTEEFLSKAFDTYNQRFFSNRITKIPVVIGRGSRGNTLGYCTIEGSSYSGRVDATKITINKKVYESRFYLEQVLLHEMCHAYQTNILCDHRLSEYKKDCTSSKGSRGHGRLFFEAADLINKSSDNKEGFKITQYEEGGHIKNQSYKTADGWLIIRTGIIGVGLTVIPNTATGRSKLANYPKNQIFTFADNEIKTKYADRLGRKDQAYTFSSPIVQSVIEDLESNNLIPLSEENPNHGDIGIYTFTFHNEEFYTIKYPVPEDKARTEQVHTVDLAGKYTVLENTLEQSMLILEDKYPNISYFKEAIKQGVFTMRNKSEDIYDFFNSKPSTENHKMRLKKEANKKENVEDMLDDIEKVENTASIKEHEDGSFIMEII